MPGTAKQAYPPALEGMQPDCLRPHPCLFRPGCVPPPLSLPLSGTDHELFYEKEDTGDLTTYRVWCPPGCERLATTNKALNISTGITGGLSDDGEYLYDDTSPICSAAAHAGIVRDDGGYVTVQLREGAGSKAGPAGTPGYAPPASPPCFVRLFLSTNALSFPGSKIA